ncbi:hypothetical protein M3I53_01240 [Paraburkholderia sp. CNPSo 3272]|uniref:hypothetical protein n=1 Tax=Paraburkholderia sp. CNPSo 3272 TaxID=2940931 RepID=UPI0020B73D60|nr:hypothetical protein [Paraburkholderia sp. CNPSo 3272]MCP3721761.1 hypothetical protein [Paraburkholderia sp. CNPSo 3272]
MDIVEAVCIAVLIGFIIGTGVALGVAKLLKRERQSLPYAGPAIAYDAEPYPRAWE